MSRAKFESHVEPILQLAGVDFDIFETDDTGSAKEHARTFGLSCLSFCNHKKPIMPLFHEEYSILKSENVAS